jgi:hypothetical protein
MRALLDLFGKERGGLLLRNFNMSPIQGTLVTRSTLPAASPKESNEVGVGGGSSQQ